MAENKLVSSIDLNLSNSELKTLISDVKLSLAFVVDVNHDGSGADDLNVGDVKAKSLDTAGTSDLMDSIYRPLNPNISQFPLAGEFIVTLETSLGRYYLTTVNLFNQKDSNIDRNNTSGYVKFKDDENTNPGAIKKDSKTQKSVLQNNKSPFDSFSNTIPFPYFNRFGDVNVDGRYGNRISLTRSNRGNPEILLQNSTSTIEIKNGAFSYLRKGNNPNIDFTVNNEITSEYIGEQIYMDSDRLFANIGNEGLFLDTSGIISLASDEDMFINSFKELHIEGQRIDLGRSADQKVILGDIYLTDFEQLMNAMVRFAQSIKAQEKILSLSNAANNFLTDIRGIGWDNFNKDGYLSEKVYTE